MPLDGVSPFGPYPAPRIDPVAVDELGQQQGYRVKWEKALPCPRRLLKDLSKHDFNCPVCENAFGMIYFDPLTSYTDAKGLTNQELRMTVVSIPLHVQNMDGGVVLPGSALISMPVGIKVGYKDRITLRDSRIRVTEIVKRGAGAIDKLKYPAVTIAQDPSAGLVRVQADATVYSVPSQVTLTVAGDVQWVGGAPSAGTYYAVMYWRRASYIVMDLLHVVRDTMRPAFGYQGPESNYDLGGQVQAQLDFMVRDEAHT